ncbi:MAG: A/G-specific adenine glycosylase [Bacteroidetes bacterium]|nr:MAG: A/G-specific adenine glycosylase [Bacteroidota bacterium]
MNFTTRLLHWYHKNHRDLPWRDTKDPYKIWLSEIILQQTRIAQGIQYYYRFIEKFPNVKSLAATTEDEVLSLWQGLGYYSRARNLHETAKNIVDKYEGRFPESYNELLALKGVGPYTAAAIASIAFGKNFATVDGNVSRVIARYFYIHEPIDENNTQKQIKEIAAGLIDHENPGMFNQAMMDLGATVCKPGKPLCNICPLNEDCGARIKGVENELPLKKNKVKIKERFFHFLFIFRESNNEKEFFIEKRQGNDIWKNLYQLPLIETSDAFLSEEEFKKHPLILSLQAIGFDASAWGKSFRIEHLLTHQRIYAFFHVIPLPADYNHTFDKTFLWVDFQTFSEMGKPVLINKFFRKYLSV